VARKKPGPKKGDPRSKAAGRKGGKSMPSRKKGRKKVNARHGKRAKR
jgi:hypothetical protein